MLIELIGRHEDYIWPAFLPQNWNGVDILELMNSTFEVIRCLLEQAIKSNKKRQKISSRKIGIQEK